MTTGFDRYKEISLVPELFSLEQAAAELNGKLDGIKKALEDQGLFHPKFKKRFDDDSHIIEARDEKGRFVSQDKIKSAFLGAEAALNPLAAVAQDSDNDYIVYKDEAAKDEADKIRADRNAEEEAAVKENASAENNDDEDVGISADFSGEAPQTPEDKKKGFNLDDYPLPYQDFLKTMAGYAGQGWQPGDVQAVIGDDLITRLQDEGRGISFHKNGEMRLHYKDGGHLRVRVTHDNKIFINLEGKKMDEQSAHDVVMLQRARGSSVLVLRGPKAARQLMWRAAQMQGASVTAESYRPNPEDIEFLKAVEAERQKAKAATQDAEAEKKQETETPVAEEPAPEKLKQRTPPPNLPAAGIPAIKNRKPQEEAPKDLSFLEDTRGKQDPAPAQQQENKPVKQSRFAKLAGGLSRFANGKKKPAAPVPEAVTPPAAKPAASPMKPR